MRDVMPEGLDLQMPQDTRDIHQGHALLSFCEAFTGDDDARAYRSFVTSTVRGRHREHTAALTALLDELAARMECPVEAVPTVFAAAGGLPKVMVETCHRAAYGKPLLVPTNMWVRAVSLVMLNLLMAWSGAHADQRDVITGARVRLYEAA